MKERNLPELPLDTIINEKGKKEKASSPIPLTKLELTHTLGRLKAMETVLQPCALDSEKYRQELEKVKRTPLGTMYERLMEARLNEVSENPEYYAALVQTFDQKKITQTLRELLVKENSERVSPQEEFDF